jgi:hypothetical protein
MIADLSLHYFSWDETKKIVNEIKRVLKEDGFLLVRVNSVNDTNYGAGKGISSLLYLLTFLKFINGRM